MHFPSLSLLSFVWVNLQLTCSQSNPQIQFRSYHPGSPHMTLKVIFHKVKGNILKRFYSFQHDILLPVFFTVVVLINKNFLCYQTKAFEQYHVKQTKFRLGKRLNNHPHGSYGHWLSTSTSKRHNDFLIVCFLVLQSSFY